VTFFCRQLVSTLTAASVLLCGVVCACGGSVQQADAVQAALAAPSGEGHGSHCHGQHDHHAKNSDSRPQNPQPCKDGGRSCQHCQSKATVGTASHDNSAHLTPFAHFVGLLDVSPNDYRNPPLVVTRRSTLGDLPPPVCPTLLSLHCALTT
jgi:hypothetical protein